MARPQIDSLNAAMDWIETLEDALAEFAVLAGADDVDIKAELVGRGEAEIAAFRRDTLYLDLSIFHRAAELTEHRFR